MIRSLNTAEQAMQMQQLRIDALANNLANVNSTGFRGVLTRVSERNALESTDNIQDAGDPAAKEALPLPKGSENWQPVSPLDLFHATDTRRGPVQATGRDTDVAILGRGFFAIQTDVGERYTRGGSFRVNDQQELTTPDGQRVLSTGGPIILNGEDFSVESDGRVMVDGAEVGQLKIVDFPDPSRLEHLGSNLMRAPDNVEAQNVPIEEVQVAQGHLEGSNVNAIDTLVAMIAAQRAFEVQSKVMNTEDDMLSKSVNNLPRVSA